VWAASEIQAPALQLSVMSRVFVREFRFEGNTVFTTGELARVTAPYTGREVTSEELEDARRAVTLFYIQRGYINSGAILPEQSPPNGVITLRLVEGQLSDFRLTGNKWLRQSYLEGRIRRWAGSPLNMNNLREGLQLLRLNPNVTQVNAEVKPGAAPGEATLDARVADEQPFRVGLQFDNYRPPSVGSMELLLSLADLNLTGHGDPLELSYRIFQCGTDGFQWSGDDNIAGAYAIPLNSYNTTLRFFGDLNDAPIVEQPFDILDIKTKTYRVGGTVRQPFYLSAQKEFALAATFEWKRSETTLLGKPFDVSPGSVNGIATVAALRLSQEWIERGQDQVVALRSTFSIGLDALDATERTHTNRDGHFFSWLGQFQYVRRLFNTPNQLILRANGQFGTQPLLALEQFAIGGIHSVRGYRENQLVRDQGVTGSVELRVPVLFNRKGAAVVQLAPFVDGGGGWNNDAPTPNPRSILSAGIGVIFTPSRHFSAQFYWGYAFVKIDESSTDPQDYGFLFSVTANLF
jgi:hemolysin activation/secretion protein